MRKSIRWKHVCQKIEWMQLDTFVQRQVFIRSCVAAVLDIDEFWCRRGRKQWQRYLRAALVAEALDRPGWPLSPVDTLCLMVTENPLFDNPPDPCSSSFDGVVTGNAKLSAKTWFAEFPFFCSTGQ